jgi:resuscitation-promoting factor RpfA
MRLVCPNCEAKYEVPEDAIPETGRDVQCANCGHAWYQMRQRTGAAEPVAAAAVAVPPAPEVAPETAPVAVEQVETTPEVTVVEEVLALESDAKPEPEPVAAEASPGPVEMVEVAADKAMSDPEPEAVVEAAVEEVAQAPSEVVADDPVVAVTEEVVVEAVPEPTPVAARPDATDEPKSDEVPAAEVPPAGTAVAPAAYAVDDSVLAILREEAERETQARRAETGKPLEVQADLGIDAAQSKAKKPVEVLSSDDPVLALIEESDDKTSARRTRLPDVEEINSTLRPNEQPVAEVDAAMPVPVEGRSSFRSGFLLVMTVAILGMALYSSADALASAVPALEGVLKGYVGFVDSLRLQLDGLMQSATLAINGNGP